VSNSRSRQFSLRGAAVAVVTVGVGAAAGLVLVPTVGSYLGMVLGGFLAGLCIEKRPVLESGLAAALASLGILWSGVLVGNGVVDAVVALGSVAPTTLLVSTVLSFAVGAFGAHLGDDLRDGLTTPVEPTTAGETTAGPTTATPTDRSTPARESAEKPTVADAVEDSTQPPPGDSKRGPSGGERDSQEELEREREQ